jgi:hypothetical protein
MEQRIQSFELVGEAIGQEMDAAFKRIIQRLAAGEGLENVDEALAPSLTNSVVNDFFENLNGASLSLDFKPAFSKQPRLYFNGHRVEPQALVAGGVSVSIGIQVSF